MQISHQIKLNSFGQKPRLEFGGYDEMKVKSNFLCTRAVQLILLRFCLSKIFPDLQRETPWKTKLLVFQRNVTGRTDRVHSGK